MIRLTRTGNTLIPDQTRVLLRPFVPGDGHKMRRIIARILDFSEEMVLTLLDEISGDFARRHEGIVERFRERFEEVWGPLGATGVLPAATSISDGRRLLVGAYFLAEYSLESAALFNPSMVAHPDQTGLPAGSLRFVLSLRATGEGHISSITFRTGVIHPDNSIEVMPPLGMLTEARRIGNKELADPHEAFPGYEVQFRPDQDLSQRVLFPLTAAQRNGIEDARFVRFLEDDGAPTYYATFTAYDGRSIRPELLETGDFLRYRFIVPEGSGVQNKGMALFPRRIHGRYAMLSRQDNESIFLMYSDSIGRWDGSELLLAPEFPWDMVQVGNCGSPIETEAGWLVLNHGVGAMRRYCVGAFLLDRDDPSKVIGRLREPLLEPSETEREGYVPNVVYSCGSLVHNGMLVIPYGVADHATAFATVPLAEVLDEMKSAA